MDELSREDGILFDIMFFVINIIAVIPAVLLLGNSYFAPLVIVALLAVIHTILTIFIWRKFDISGARLFLMQIGGWTVPVISAIAWLIFAFLGGWGILVIVGYVFYYACAIIPAVILSFIARFIYNRIKSN